MQIAKSDIRETLFVKYFISDPKQNLSEAATKAGYTQKNARQQATKLMRKASVQALLRKFSARAEQQAGITRARILNELGRLGFSNMQDYIDVSGGRVRIDLSSMTRDEAAAIQELTVEETTEGKGKNKRAVTRTKLKLANKRESLELLGRHHKLFTEETQGPGVAVILVDIPRPGGRNLTARNLPQLPEGES